MTYFTATACLVGICIFLAGVAAGFTLGLFIPNFTVQLPKDPRCIRCNHILHRVTVEEVGFPLNPSVRWYCNNSEHDRVLYFNDFSDECKPLPIEEI